MLSRFVCALCLSMFLTAPRAAYSEELYDIGEIHYQVTTDSESAQTWFDQGLALCYAFNHEEAVGCFERAVAADPGLAMAYWGIAYAWGPNINNMEIEPHFIAQADFAIRLAKLHAGDCTELEKKLINALGKRYASPAPTDRSSLNQSYADAMREIYESHSDDPLVATLFAESLLNLQPWRHWSPEGVAAEHTPEIMDVLKAGLKRWPNSPSLCHLYIHTMEASPTPEKALAAANRLRLATPGLGHLLHMPSHIDIWVGDYGAAIEANKRGIAADEKFLARRGPLNFYSLYRIHNYHFLVYAAMFDGQSNLALETARKIPKQVPEIMLRAQVDFLDAFMPTELHVLVRFGKWDAILAYEQPADYLPMSRSIWRYARAIAYASTGEVDKALAEQAAFLKQISEVPETSFLFQNPSRNILDVAKEMVAGEIAYRQGKFDKAFEHLRIAVERDDALNYDEPWGWMQPARHALGALLLEQKLHEEALKVYQEDLQIHPKNPWALHGLAECLTALGRVNEAEEIRKQYRIACQRSDVAIDRSCFCRLNVK
ncbi:MAG: tetratricopeptide repeat protein [Planctomycetota bacterium]